LPLAIATQKRPIQRGDDDDFLGEYGAELQQRRAKLEEEQASTFDAPDYSKMSAYAKDRSAQGQRDLMLALAAGLGGEETKPVGAMFLKQAAEARNPLKVATGLIDESGNYIEDAEAVQDRKAKRLDARIKSLDTLISSNINAQDKREARREREAAALELKRMTAGIGAGMN
jgi:hypothetical protein